LFVQAWEREENMECLFRVTDTGPGIAAADLDRIFKEFEQAESPGGSSTSGTGLGLAICKALVESQGGSIEVESTLGEGSHFTVRLAFKLGVMSLPVVERKAIVRTDFRKDKVWIVDDDRLILDLCARIFERNGIPHRCFNVPEELLRAEWDESVRYILLDIRMPGMNGMELCALLRKSVPTPTRIYALTAQVLPGEREAILDKHFDGLLMKPFTENDLLMVLSARGTAASHAIAYPASAMHNTDAPLAPDEPKLLPAGHSLDWDRGWIEKMTFGDHSQMTRILKRFSEDSANDITALRHSIEKKNYPQTLLLVHRIAGRTAQMGVKELARDFRRVEMELTLSQQFSQEKKDSLLSLSQKLGDLVREISLS